LFSALFQVFGRKQWKNHIMRVAAHKAYTLIRGSQTTAPNKHRLGWLILVENVTELKDAQKTVTPI
jgi:hypothetical protein